MIDSYCRQTYQKLLADPIVPLIKEYSPQTITLAGCCFGLCVLPALYLGYNWLAFLFLLFSGFLDTLDGSLARYLKVASPKGAALDIVCDRIVEFAVILGLFLVDPDNRAFSCLLMLGSILICVTSFLVVGIFSENESSKSFYYSPGLIERAEAFIFFSLMILFPDLFFLLTYIFILLTVYTAIRRLRQFIK